MMSDDTSEPGQMVSDKQPIDDMRDGEDIQGCPDPLGQVISYIHADLFEIYSEYDQDSLKFQNRHKVFSFLAVLCGSIAIVVAIIQVFLTSRGIGYLNEHLKFIELVSFCFAVIAVIVAVGSHYHKGWLKKRYMAEQYRSLKFRSLLQPALYCSLQQMWEERLAAWKNWLNTEKILKENVEKNELKDCIESDTISSPPPDLSGCGFDEGYLNELVHYYQAKRLKIQIDYFEKRASDLESWDKFPRRVVSACFILSVFFLFGHYIIDLTFLKNTAWMEDISGFFLLCVLLLPILALSFRTFRSSSESARSASLFRSKRNALMDFNECLIEENRKKIRDWPQIINIIWECENYLENENREWLRIMFEAEWFI